MAPTGSLPNVSRAVEFTTSFLESRLVQVGVAVDAADARALAEEVKKYLVLSALRPERPVPMFSSRVDEAWHQFVLFSGRYAAFCAETLGRVMHHEPEGAASVQPEPAVSPMTFADFARGYRELFGSLPEVWRDELWLTPSTRLRRFDEFARFAVEVRGDRLELVLSHEPETALCRVNRPGEAALRFIADNDVFLIRELPGLSQASDKIRLCQPLVRLRTLRIAP